MVPLPLHKKVDSLLKLKTIFDNLSEKMRDEGVREDFGHINAATLFCCFRNFRNSFKPFFYF